MPQAPTTAPASDNDTVFYLDNNGEIVAVNNKSGDLEWRIKNPGVDEVFLESLGESLFSKVSFISGETQTKSTFISAVKARSGVPYFRKSVDGPGKIVSDADALYLVGDSKEVSAYSIGDGRKLWSFNAKIELNPVIDTNSAFLFISSTENTLLKISKESGKIVSQLNTGDETAAVVATEDRVFLGTRSGKMKALDSEGRELWSNWSGGGISEVLLKDDVVIFSSKDNFVYGIDIVTGKKNWKRKLAGRILGSAKVSKDLTVYVTTGSSTALVLNNKNGLIVGKYEFRERFASKPVAISDGFAVVTTNQITAIRTNNCGKEKSRSK